MSVALTRRRLWGLALGGGITMFLVQPPADLWWLAWLAPLPWLALVQAGALPDRWLRVAWAAGFLHWLATIHWLRLPHPATAIGWVALSAYLAAYVPLFIWLARRLVHARGWPLVPAAVLAWISCEQLRGTLLGGFTFAGLGHTQWRWTMLLQTADIVGSVGVSGIVMGVAAAGAAVWSASGGQGSRDRLANLAAASGILAAALAYGAWRLATVPPSDERSLDVLLVQGSIDTELKHDPEAAGDVLLEYDTLTREGLASGPPPDLVVWPETMWRWGLVEIDPAEMLDEAVVAHALAAGPQPADPAARQAAARSALEGERLEMLGRYARRYGTNWLVGLDKQRITPRVPAGVEHFNCGLFLDADGQPLGCYDKMHPVMFGEYVPLAGRFPWLYRLTPLPAGLTAGRAPVAVEIAGRRVAATICYETALPEAVRTLVLDLARGGGRPDVLVNLTNDGWFWGSSELDMHLTAALFRAVEVRTPILIAANTGFSAWIDGSGRLLSRGPRRATATLRAAAVRDGRWSPWLAAGSLPLWAGVAIAAALAVAGCLPCTGPPPSPTIRDV